MKKTKPAEKTKRKMTPNRAAAEVRHEIRRKALQLEKDFTVAETKWRMLLEYISTMARRASKKIGGLGTK